jgi:hypothetical protein
MAVQIRRMVSGRQESDEGVEVLGCRSDRPGYIRSQPLGMPMVANMLLTG